MQRALKGVVIFMFVNTDCCLLRIQIFIKQFDSKSYVFNIYVVSSHKSLLSYTSSNLQIDVVHYVVNQQQQYGGVCTQRHLSRTLKFRISIPMQIPPPQRTRVCIYPLHLMYWRKVQPFFYGTLNNVSKNPSSRQIRK